MKKEVGIEFRGILDRLGRAGTPHQDVWGLVKDEGFMRDFVSMVKPSIRLLKDRGVDSPLWELYRFGYETYGTADKRAPVLAEAMVVALHQLSILVWGFRMTTGKLQPSDESGITVPYTNGERRPREELVAYEVEHDLDTPGKWNSHCVKKLKDYGFM